MSHKETGTLRLKTGFAEMLKGGVIMDVTNAEQARIAEDAGAVAVMALERVPSEIRRDGGVSRMSHPQMIQEIMTTVSIPVMAKCRIGHFAEAQVLQALGVDFIDESEVLTPADQHFHVDKHAFDVPFVCGARDLGEALRRVGEGAAMIRTKGEAGSGDIVQAVEHLRAITSGLRRLTQLRDDELMTEAKELGAPYEVVRRVATTGRLPVPNFSAGGIATPADASLVMQLGPRPCSSAAASSPVKTRLATLAPSCKRRHTSLTRASSPRSRARWPEPCVASTPARCRRVRCCSSAAGDAVSVSSAVSTADVATPVESAVGGRGRVGVLALQGDFAAHRHALAALDVTAAEIRRPEQLTGLDALVMPGGESTTLLKLMGYEPAWWSALGQLVRRGVPVLGPAPA